MIEKRKYKLTCKTCECEFTYDESEIQSDRDGCYVICPNSTCGSFISHNLSKPLFNPFK